MLIFLIKSVYPASGCCRPVNAIKVAVLVQFLSLSREGTLSEVSVALRDRERTRTGL